MHYIYRQQWQKIVNNQLVKAGYSYHHSQQTAELYDKHLDASQKSIPIMNRLYAKGTPSIRTVSDEFFRYIKGKADYSLEYGVFLVNDPSLPVSQNSFQTTLAEMFGRK